LESWSAAYITDTPTAYNQDDDKFMDPSTLLARVFYAAISIYLSGVFDYELCHWQQLHLPVPIIDQDTIEQHVYTILTLADIGTNHTTLSPLLFLFPLRIAGARSRYQWQRDRVGALVDRIGEAFAVASTIRGDLAQVWKIRAVVPCPVDAGTRSGRI
jgi:hypothetical protein